MLRPTDRRVSSRDPAGHLGPQPSTREPRCPVADVVPGPLGGEVGEDGGVEPAHPVVGVRRGARRARRARAAARRDRRAGRRSVMRGTVLLQPRRPPLAAVAGSGRAPALGRASRPRPAPAASEKVTFTVGITNEVDSFNPFLGIEAKSYEMWALTYDYLVRLLDGGHVARARAGHGPGRPPRTA